MTCGECSKFSECFNASNDMLDVSPEKVDVSMVDTAMAIPACEGFQRAEVK